MSGKAGPEAAGMPPGSDRDYHVERTRMELDAAYRAVGSGAAAAHLRLCSMHMARARSLPDPATPPELEWIERCRPFHEWFLAEAD
jgi:hypothetical protein